MLLWQKSRTLESSTETLGKLVKDALPKAVTVVTRSHEEKVLEIMKKFVKGKHMKAITTTSLMVSNDKGGKDFSKTRKCSKPFGINHANYNYKNSTTSRIP